MQTQTINRDPSEPELRTELRSAIEIHKAAHNRAHKAKQDASRAKALLDDAQEAVDKLQTEVAAARKLAIEQSGAAKAAAIQEARTEIPIAISADVDTAQLDKAIFERDAIEVAHARLSQEHNAIAGEAASAAAEVRAKANMVMDCIGKHIVSELIVARNAFWRLEEVASGFFLMDEHREVPRFTALKDETWLSLNRQATARSEHPEFVERHRWIAHIDALNAATEKRWREFGQRLEQDADATLEPSKGTIEPPPHLSIVRS